MILQAQVNKLQEELQAAVTTGQSSQQASLQLQQQLQQRQGESAQFQLQLQEAQDQICQLRQKLQQAQVLPAQLQQQLLSMQEQSEQLQRQVTAAQEQCCRLTQEIQDVSAHSDQLQEELQTQGVAHEQLIDQLKVQLQSGLERHAVSQDAAAESQAQLTAAISQAQSLEAQMFASKHDAIELTAAAHESHAQLTTAQLKCSELEARLSEMSVALQSSDTNLKTSTAVSHEYKQQLAVLQTQLSSWQQRYLTFQRQKSLRPRSPEEEAQNADQQSQNEEVIGGQLVGEEENEKAGAVGAIVDKLWKDLQQERVSHTCNTSRFSYLLSPSNCQCLQYHRRHKV